MNREFIASQERMTAEEMEHAAAVARYVGDHTREAECLRLAAIARAQASRLQGETA